MRKICSLFLLLALSLVCVHAETVLLRTGARVQGTIVFQNEDVVIIRNAEGARFQYLRTDVEEIIEDDRLNELTNEGVEEEDPEIKTSKKATILLELAGGAAIQPKDTVGGGFSVDLLVGSHHIKDTHLFVGGGLGYHGLFLGADKYNFLPIQVAVRMPFIEAKHAPMFGVAVGYGVALSKNYLGGLYTGLDFGYRCQLNPKTALALVGYAQFQQATITQDVTVESSTFAQRTTRSLITTGLKLAFYF